MNTPIIDGHNDVLSHLHDEGAPDDALLSEDAATITVPRARAGGLAAGLFAVLPPAPAWEIKRTPGGYDIPISPAVGLGALSPSVGGARRAAVPAARRVRGSRCGSCAT